MPPSKLVLPLVGTAAPHYIPASVQVQALHSLFLLERGAGNWVCVYIYINIYRCFGEVERLPSKSFLLLGCPSLSLGRNSSLFLRLFFLCAPVEVYRLPATLVSSLGQMRQKENWGITREHHDALGASGSLSALPFSLHLPKSSYVYLMYNLQDS